MRSWVRVGPAASRLASLLESSPGLWAGITGPGSAILLVVPGVPALVPVVLAGVAYGLSVLELDIPRTVAGRPDQGENRLVALWAGTVSVGGAAAVTSMVTGIQKLSIDWLLLGLLIGIGLIYGTRWFDDLESRLLYRESLEPQARTRYSRSVEAAVLFSLALGTGLGDLLALWGAIVGALAGISALARAPEDLPSLRVALGRLRRIGGGLERRLWREVRQAGEYPGSLYHLHLAFLTLFYMSFFLPFTDIWRAGLVPLLPTLLLIGVVSLTLLVVTLDLQHWSWSFTPALGVYGSILVLAIGYGEAFPLAQTFAEALTSGGGDVQGYIELGRTISKRIVILTSLWFLSLLITTLPGHKVDVADWRRDPESQLRWLNWGFVVDVAGTLLIWAAFPLLLVPPLAHYIESELPNLFSLIEFWIYVWPTIVAILGALIWIGSRISLYRRSRKELVREYGESIASGRSEGTG